MSARRNYPTDLSDDQWELLESLLPAILHPSFDSHYALLTATWHLDPRGGVQFKMYIAILHKGFDDYMRRLGEQLDHAIAALESEAAEASEAE